MSRRAAKHTQADYARALRAAEQATGEKHMIVFGEDGEVRIEPRRENAPSTAPKAADLAKVRDFRL